MTRLSLALVACSASPRARSPPTRRRSSPTSRASRSRPTPSGSLKALEFLGAPLPADAAKALAKAIEAKDAKKVQEVLDPHVLFVVTINPESRVKVARGPAEADAPAGRLTSGARQGRQREHGEEAAARSPARSPGRVYSGAGATRRTRRPTRRSSSGSSQVEMFTAPPMTARPERPEGRVRHRASSTRPRPASARRPSASTSARGTRTSASAARCRCSST